MKSTKSASLLPDLRLRFVSGHRYDGRVRPLPKDTPRTQSIPSYHSSRELGCVPFTLINSVSVYSSERTLGATTALFNVCEWKSSKSFLKLQILIQRFEVIEKRRKKPQILYLLHAHRWSWGCQPSGHTLNSKESELRVLETDRCREGWSTILLPRHAVQADWRTQREQARWKDQLLSWKKKNEYQEEVSGYSLSKIDMDNFKIKWDSVVWWFPSIGLLFYDCLNKQQ